MYLGPSWPRPCLPLSIYFPLPFLIFLCCFSLSSPPSRLFSSQNNVCPGVFTPFPSGKEVNEGVVVGDYLWRSNAFLGGGEPERLRLSSEEHWLPVRKPQYPEPKWRLTIPITPAPGIVTQNENKQKRILLTMTNVLVSKELKKEVCSKTSFFVSFSFF